MRVLVVNAGSSTLKLQVVGPDDRVEADAQLDPWSGDHAAGAFDEVLAGAGPVDAVGHRVVHGGRDLTAATVVDGDIRARIAALVPLAPLHQPRALVALDAARQALPDRPHIACFDTAFHATLPPAARTYALPRAWRQRWTLDRCGFHGLSHAWAARRARRIANRRDEGLRIVSCHLGAGASLCAVLDGQSIDTTMGFTPLEGVVMATRSGSVDPGLLLWLLEHGGLPPGEIADGLHRRAGLAGLSGTSGDMREVLRARAAGDADAALAFDVYIHRLRREVAAMAAALGGIDILAFTGGIGEHSPSVRAAAVAGLGFLGAELDLAANDEASGDADLTPPGSATATVVVTAREDLEIVRQVRQVAGGAGTGPTEGAGA